MIDLDGIQTFFSGIGEDVKTFVKEKPLATAGIGAAALGATALGITAIIRKPKKRVAKKKKNAKRRGRRKDYKYRSKQKHELAYVRRKRKAGKKITRPRYKTKRTSKKRTGKIYYTKKGQPYKIKADGRAIFIKKSKGRKR